MVSYDQRHHHTYRWTGRPQESPGMLGPAFLSALRLALCLALSVWLWT